MSEPKLPPLPAPYIGAKARVGGEWAEWAEYAESELRAYGLACYRQGFVEGARACQKVCEEENSHDASTGSIVAGRTAAACARIAEKGAADAS
jgi:hypothetical protein